MTAPVVMTRRSRISNAASRVATLLIAGMLAAVIRSIIDFLPPNSFSEFVIQTGFLGTAILYIIALFIAWGLMSLSRRW